MLGARDWHQVLVNLYRYAWIASIYYIRRRVVQKSISCIQIYFQKYLGFLVFFSFHKH